MPIGYGVQVRKILPPKFHSEIFSQYYRDVMHGTAEKLKKDAQAITKDWEHKVRWHYKVIQTHTKIGFNLFVENDEAGKIFAYWELGTKKHKIRPKKQGGFLAFQWEKGAQLNIPARRLPDGRFLFKEVNHPGTKGHFKLEKMANRAQRMFLSDLEQANMQAVKKCGHGA